MMTIINGGILLLTLVLWLQIREDRRECELIRQQMTTEENRTCQLATLEGEKRKLRRDGQQEAALSASTN